MRSIRPSSGFWLSGFYLFQFGALGAYLPYFPLYLDSLRFSSAQIGLILALVPGARALLPTVWGAVADRYRLRYELILWTCVLSAASFAGLWATGSFMGVMLVVALFAVCWSAASPLVDATAMDQAESHGLDYGRVRLWGSIGFILATVVLGQILDVAKRLWAVHFMVILLAGNALACIGLPRSRPHAAEQHPRISALLRSRGFVTLLGCAFLMLASHGTLYGFFSIHLETLGYSKLAIGGLWSVGVVAELLLFYFSGGLLRRFGSVRLIRLSLVLAVLRWGICAATGNAAALVFAQALHAFSFAAFHVSMIGLAHRLARPQLRGSAQSLLNGVSYGLGQGVGIYLSGVFYDVLGAPALFLASGAVAALGALLALRLTDGSSQDPPHPLA
ncbi:MAG TPA: major facilitator superfamily domain-containing protein 6 [Acidobacteriota bacterium]